MSDIIFDVEEVNITLEFCFEAWDKVLEFVFLESCYYVCRLDRLFAFELGVFIRARREYSVSTR